jgi:hypothetical protein
MGFGQLALTDPVAVAAVEEVMNGMEMARTAGYVPQPYLLYPLPVHRRQNGAVDSELVFASHRQASVAQRITQLYLPCQRHMTLGAEAGAAQN